jgi:hypothetical protein
LHLFRHELGSLTALVAAFVLVLQSSLTAWASTTTPADPMLDSWGNVLCITGMDQEDGNPANDSSGMPDCCTPGCGVSSAALAAPSSADIAQAAPAAPADLLPDHDPGSPRAPPLTI